ncbi:MAG: hypothetical protein ABIV28_03550, partial [Longimicrobiales bacterium]
LVFAAVPFITNGVSAQKSAPEIVSQQISLSRTEAALRIERSDGRTVDIAIHGGQAYLNGTNVGGAPRSGELDRSFRELLSQITDAQSSAVPGLLKSWSPNHGTAAATRLDRALEEAATGVIPAASPEAPAAPDAPNAPGAPGLDAQDAAENGIPSEDSVERLNDRISELQGMVDNLQDDEGSASVDVTRRGRWNPGPFYSLRRGLADVFSVLVLYVILFALAVAVIAFGGRKYIEGVADTARQMTMRSWLVGLAATFLVIPAFVLGIIALTISIVGIPALLAWVPLFPLAVVLSLALGYLAVAHAAGESLAERRFYVNDWFKRGNSYYFIINGLGVLLAMFIAAGVVEMAGPWFGFIRGLLLFLGVVCTWAAFTVGFGAVLVSRAGTRPLGKAPAFDDFVEEESHV